MKSYRLTFSIFILAVFAASCSPYVNVVDVQALSPSAYAVDMKDKRLAVIGNLFYNNAALGKEGGYVIDSALVAAATLGIKTGLEQSPLFEGVSLPIYYTYSDTSLIGKPITPADVDSLAKQMDADMLASVEYIAIDVTPLHSGSEYSSSYDIVYRAHFRLYSAGGATSIPFSIRSKAPETFSYNDTNGQLLVVPTEDAKVMLAENLGREFALRLAPYWENVQRVYYLGPDDSDGYLGRADRLAQTERWADAMQLWEKALSSGKKSVRAMAAFNLAVGSEMLGDLELAKSWLEYCKKLDTKVNPSAYMSVITKRIADKKTLDESLTSSNDE